MDPGYPPLRRRCDFLALRRSGRVVRSGVLLIALGANGLGITRFGLTASRKVGAAVIRNRFRRRMRPLIRRLAPHCKPGYDINIIARSDAATTSQTRLEPMLRRALRSIRTPEQPDRTQ